VVSTPEQAPSGRRHLIVDLVCVLLIMAICLAIGPSRCRAGMDWGDEGFLAYGGVRVMEGQLPHRDFVSLQPPLSFYVAAMTFKILGTSLASLRTLGLSIFVLVPLLIYACGRNLMPPLFAIAAALPAIILGIPSFNFVPYAVWQGITISLAAAALYLYALHARHNWLALFAGVLTTISIFLRHDQGIYLAISLLILTLALYCAKQSALPASKLKRALAWWSAGTVTVALSFTIYWLAEGALPETPKPTAPTKRRRSQIPTAFIRAHRTTPPPEPSRTNMACMRPHRTVAR